MNSFDLSVVLTTHYRPKLLKRALESLLDQTYKNFQILLCSDEGSEETKDVAKNYLRENDCFLVLPQLIGPSSTRNEGVRNANAKNIIFLDDDDTFEPFFFEKILSTIGSTADSLYYCNFSKHDEVQVDQDIMTENVTRINQANNITDIFIGNYIPNNSFIINSLIAKSVHFDSSLKSHEDWDYLIELSKKISFKHVDIYGPNVHSLKNLSRNKDAYRNGSVALDFLSIYRKHPTKDPKVREARKFQLESFGINVPAELL
jgi:glycosyltransferase involved in cell wall biosynthesis